MDVTAGQIQIGACSQEAGWRKLDPCGGLRKVPPEDVEPATRPWPYSPLPRVAAREVSAQLGPEAEGAFRHRTISIGAESADEENRADAAGALRTGAELEPIPMDAPGKLVAKG